MSADCFSAPSGPRYATRGAQSYLAEGKAYAAGRDVPQDQERAFWNFSQAARAGSRIAHYYLGLAHACGEGVPVNDKLAMAHFKKAAKSDARFQGGRGLFRSGPLTFIGMGYSAGKGVRRDQKKARRWYLEAKRCAPPENQAFIDGLIKQTWVLPSDRVFDLAAATVSAWACTLAGAAVVATWQYVTSSSLAAECALLTGLGLWTARLAIATSGGGAQNKVREKFEAALMSGESQPWIGGVKWCVVNGDFHHLFYNLVGRGWTYKPGTGHEARFGAEVGSHRSRLQTFVGSLAVIGGAGFVAATTPYLTASAIVGGAALLASIGCLAAELIYRRGYQWFPGAMALDPAPNPPGRDLVREQEAHGRARLAREAEARAAAQGRSPRSPIHRQKF